VSPDPDASDRIGAKAYEALYLYSPDGVLFTIPDGRVIAANPAAREILQMPEDEICALGRLGLSDRSDERWAPLVAERDLNGFAHGVARMIRGDGHAIEVEMSARVFRDVDGELRTCTVIRDVTERVEMERRMVEMAAELRDLAVQDDLTGLRNRRGFVEMATQVLELADRQGVACHLLFLDVDNMKELNDRFGHAAGDAGLRAVASTLKGLLRRADLVARLGGDEFVALTVGLDEGQRADIASRLRERLASQSTASRVGRPVWVSVGWARHDPQDPSGIEDMFVEADRHMYRDKAAKRESAHSPHDSE
jgi:diguanylate cyclase (GGDEF)-like protein/PAS domain S-box-containing protein